MTAVSIRAATLLCSSWLSGFALADDGALLAEARSTAASLPPRLLSALNDRQGEIRGAIVARKSF
jgi:hypothetical protein